MNIIKLYIVVALLISTGSVIAQTSTSTTSTGNSGTGSNIDIKYHKFYWRINPDSSVKYIKGYVQTNFKTITANVSDISFDLSSVLIIDSVKYHGSKLSAGNIVRAGNIVTLTLGVTLPNNKLDSITIHYRGKPLSPSGASAGYYTSTDPVTNQKYIATLSESYEDRNWWPCKADMQDKIDSMDIFVNVPWSGPDTFWVASNGRLMDSAIAGNSRTFHFHSNYPMASYLLCVSVARYNRYYRGNVNVNGTLVPIVYYLYRGKDSATYADILAKMDPIANVVTTLSDKFGDYPFPKDKYGFYEGCNAGGMEHQSFSAINSGALKSTVTLAHELTHQWFGDKVTFATWNDLWLAEGFASYGEVLSAELLPSLNLNANSMMASFKIDALSTTNASAWIPNSNIGSSDLIWQTAYGNTVYNRGCMVVSMLRAMSGDTKFYQALKNYMSSPGLAYNTATTDSLKDKFNAVLGIDTKPFFDDYVMGTGNPTYTMNCQKLPGNKLSVSVASQTKTSGSAVSYFRSPIVLNIQGIGGEDTTIVLFDWGNGNLSYAGNGISAPIPGNQLIYNLSFAANTISFDPNSVTMAQGSIILNLKVIDFSVLKKEKYNEASLVLDDNTSNSVVEIERSNDAAHFITLGEMKLKPATLNKTYLYKDESPANGYNYYRAKFLDEKGTFIYSKTLQVLNGKENDILIVNDALNGRIKIQILNENNSINKYAFSVYDNLGKLVLQEEKFAGNGWIELKLNQPVAGIYTLKISLNGEQVKAQQFLVK